MIKISRVLQRILFYLLKLLIIPLQFIHPRLYMSAYIPYLKLFGMHIDGKPRYIARTVKFDDFNRVYLSERDVISGEVKFLTHDYSLTTALIAIGEDVKLDVAKVKDIHIGKNCFIGARSFVLPGTTLGDNCIVGAGSVVRGKYPSNSLIIGNPGNVVGKVDELAEKWRKLPEAQMRKDKF